MSIEQPSPTGVVVIPDIVRHLLPWLALGSVVVGALMAQGIAPPGSIWFKLEASYLAVCVALGIASPGWRSGWRAGGRVRLGILVALALGALLLAGAARAQQRAILQSDAPRLAVSGPGEHPLSWGVLVAYDGTGRLGEGVFLTANLVNLGPVGLGAGALLGAAQSLIGLPPSTLTGIGLTVRLFDAVGYVGGVAGLVTTDPLCPTGANCVGWAVGFWGAPAIAFPR